MASPASTEFRSVWTEVHGLLVHAKVSTPTPPQADRPPLVLVHGLDLSHCYMMPTAERLGGDFRVYVPDLPGFGQSAHPEKTLDVPSLADALAAWMEASGVPRAALLGNSFACQIIVDLAARHPRRVLKTVLQGPTTPPAERSWLWQFIRWRQNNRYNPPELGPISWRDYRRAGYLRALQSFRLALQDRIEGKRQRISDASLREAIERASRGSIDADLGGGIIKQRIARPGQGRSGDYRMLIA